MECRITIFLFRTFDADIIKFYSSPFHIYCYGTFFWRLLGLFKTSTTNQWIFYLLGFGLVVGIGFNGGDTVGPVPGVGLLVVGCGVTVPKPVTLPVGPVKYIGDPEGPTVWTWGMHEGI